MDVFELLRTNLLSPIFLAFCLGMVAIGVRSDLKFPEGLYTGLSTYLMLAIGLKGGAELVKYPASELAVAIAGTLALGLVTPILAYWGARKLFRQSKADSGALAAHYGSVSAVTFIAALAFVESAGIKAPGYLPALVAILEIPAIVIGLALGRRREDQSVGRAIGNLMTSKSIFLLLGGLIIGALSTPASLGQIKPLFGDLFRGALVIFMLDMGMIAMARLREVGPRAKFLLTYGVMLPLINGCLGVVTGWICGLGVGGSAVLGAMAASASYIAAPAAVRAALPEANPGLYLPAAVGITFPFNLSLGIPLFYQLAVRLFS